MSGAIAVRAAWPRRALTGALAGVLAAAALAAGPGVAAPVGPFTGSPIPLGTGSFTQYEAPQLVALPDGTTAAAWILAPGRASYQVRVRPAGSSTWGSAIPTVLEASWTIPSGSAPTQSFVLAPAGPGAFVVVWEESDGSDQRIRAQRLNRAGQAVGGPVTVAGPGKVALAAVDTNASGRAAVVYLSTNGTDFDTHVVTRAGESSAWAAPVTVGSVSGPISPSAQFALTTDVAVHDSGTVCALFPTAFTAAAPGTAGTVTLRTRCGAPGQLATAAPQTAVVAAGDQFTSVLGRSASIAATTSGFLVAAQVASTGVVPVPLVSPVSPLQVRARTRPAGAGSWSTAATFGLPGEFNYAPTALASESGAAIRFARLRGALGTGPGGRGYGLDQRVAQQQGAGGWAPAQSVATLSLTDPYEDALYFRAAALGPAGEMLVAAPAPALPAGWTTGFVRRSSWTESFTTSTGLGAAIGSAAVINASGRATVAGALNPSGGVVVAQTALPKPFVRQAAAIPAAPAVGVASSCGFAFTDAASVSRQWLVGGVVRGSGSTYTPTAADRGRSLVCRVTGTNPTGSTVSTSPGRVVA